MSERLRRSRQTNANGLCAKQGAAAGLMTVVASVWCHFFVVTLEVQKLAPQGMICSNRLKAQLISSVHLKLIR